jgi:nucleotide-binding universal stress UspA family protein
VVSVIDPGSLRLPGGRYQARIDQVRARREQLARALVERGQREGVAVSYVVWDGDPGDMIVEAAASEHADVVLVGSHGRGAVGRFFLGSVSEHVVRHAPARSSWCARGNRHADDVGAQPSSASMASPYFV